MNVSIKSELPLALDDYSLQFQKFFNSVFGDRINYWRDGPDITSLLSLNAEEKKLAANLLLQNIESNDPYIFECIGALKLRDAESYLRNLFSNCNNTLIPSCGLALWQITQDPCVVKKITDLLKSKEQFLKIDALSSLAKIRTNLALAGLWFGLNDEFDLVRYNALRYFLADKATDMKLSEEISKLVNKASYSKINYLDQIKSFLIAHGVNIECIINEALKFK